MGRPKGSKNKPKGKPPAKAAGKANLGKVGKVGKVATKPDPPDWLRKAMAPAKTPQKRGPKPKALKEKFQATAKAKRGTKHMAAKDKPIYDPMDDPDLKAPDVANPQLDQSLPRKPSKGTPLVLEAEPEPTPLFDEVAAGEAIPYDNAEALIAGTLGGGGDHHASAKRILGRMVEANWLLTKGTDATAAGMAIKSRKEAEAKRVKETEATKARKEGDDPGRDEWDHRDAKAKKEADKDRKGTKEGEDAWRAQA